MAKIIGLGGVFFKSKNPEELRKWYSEKLGLHSESWGAMFPFSEKEIGYQVWSPTKIDNNYFAPSESSFMINFRVDNLEEFMEQLAKNGVELIGKPDFSDYGKFAWVLDPDGNKIELWEAPKK